MHRSKNAALFDHLVETSMKLLRLPTTKADEASWQTADA
jgi:hypothetical protein